MFAIIGMEAFQGKISSVTYNENTTQQVSVILGNYTKEEHGWMVCENEKLNNTDFADLRYCANNFNDVASAFITLFEMMVVNQWHDILPCAAMLPEALQSLCCILGLQEEAHTEAKACICSLLTMGMLHASSLTSTALTINSDSSQVIGEIEKEEEKKKK